VHHLQTATQRSPKVNYSSITDSVNVYALIVKRSSENEFSFPADLFLIYTQKVRSSSRAFLNFKIFARAVDLGLFNKVMSQANHIENNPFQQKKEAVAALQAEGISVEAWVPFGSRLERYFHNPVLSKIGAKYSKAG